MNFLKFLILFFLINFKNISFPELPQKTKSMLTKLGCLIESDETICVKATLKGKKLNNLDLKNTIFSGNNLTKTSFENSDLSNANFMGTNMSQSNLSKSFLIETQFQLANLKSTNFANAKTQWANFSSSNLRGARSINFTDTFLDGETIMPNGQKAPCKYAECISVESDGSQLTPSSIKDLKKEITMLDHKREELSALLRRTSPDSLYEQVKETVKTNLEKITRGIDKKTLEKLNLKPKNVYSFLGLDPDKATTYSLKEVNQRIEAKEKEIEKTNSELAKSIGRQLKFFFKNLIVKEEYDAFLKGPDAVKELAIPNEEVDSTMNALIAIIELKDKLGQLVLKLEKREKTKQGA